MFICLQTMFCFVLPAFFLCEFFKVFNNIRFFRPSNFVFWCCQKTEWKYLFKKIICPTCTMIIRKRNCAFWPYWYARVCGSNLLFKEENDHFVKLKSNSVQVAFIKAENSCAVLYCTEIRANQIIYFQFNSTMAMVTIVLQRLQTIEFSFVVRTEMTISVF